MNTLQAQHKSDKHSATHTVQSVNTLQEPEQKKYVNIHKFFCTTPSNNQ